MKSLTPDQRDEVVRLLREIKSDVSELLSLLERARSRGTS
jgi:hypothetical protein